MSVLAIQLTKRQEQISVGVASLCPKDRPVSSIDATDTASLFTIEVFDFYDNDQLSNLDSVLVRYGRCSVYAALDDVDTGSGSASGSGTGTNRLMKRLFSLLEEKDLESFKTMKKTHFNKKIEISNALNTLVCDEYSQAMHAAESEHPLGYGCIGCLVYACRLLSSGSRNDSYVGRYELVIGSLHSFMRLDSSACDAINLLPKPDQPSKFGSIYGILNRCKTKIGSRLLMRYVRKCNN